MQSHFNTISDLAEQMEAIGAGVKDDELAITVLCSLPDRFDSLIVSLESRPAHEVTFDFVCARLLAEYSRQQESQSRASHEAVGSPEPAALQSAAVTVSRPVKKCSFCNRKVHLVADCWDKHGFPPDMPPRVFRKDRTEMANSSLEEDTWY